MAENYAEPRIFRLWTPKVIVDLGRIYPPPEAIAQAVENGIDAEATTVWVVIEQKRIMVIDNGHGMIPFLLPEDQDRIDTAYERMQSGKLPEGYDVRSKISLISRQSLNWMRECVALSSKIPGEQKNARGIRGIGAYAYFSYGNEAAIITKPTVRLAKEFWGDDLKPTEGKIPVLMLDLPSADGNLGGDPAISGEPLKDPWGKEMEYGTRLEVTNLREGIENEVKPASLAGFFSRRFGDDVRTRKVEIYVIDRVTSEGQKTRGGKEIMVQPPAYLGVPVLEKEVSASDGTPFRMLVYYDPRGKNRSLTVRRKRSEVFKLTDLLEFQKEPWNLLHGYIDFPDYLNDENLWDSAKTRLLTSKKRDQWIKKLMSFTKEIEDSIKQTESRFRQKDLEDLSKDLAAVTVNALSEIDYFRDRALIPAKKEPGKGHPRGPSKALTAVEVRVINEHNIGIPGVEIKFFQNSNLLSVKVTGLSGGISFGRVAEGKKYRVQMINPEGTRPTGATFYDFDLTSTQKGFNCRFQLYTGAPKPHRSSITSFERWMRDFEEDTDRPWVQRLRNGLIEYNTLPHTDLGMAIESNDEDLQWALFSEYTAGAFSEFFAREDQERGDEGFLSFEERIGQLLAQKSLLYAKIYQYLRQVRQEHKKKLAAGRRK